MRGDNLTYSRTHRTFEWVGILSFLALCVYCAWLLHGELSTGNPWLYAIWPVTFVVGYLVADFVSGVLHWAGDRYGSTTTVVLGPNFVRPFREHHSAPELICKHDFVEVNGNNCIVSIPFIMAAIYLPNLGSQWLTASVRGVLLFLCLAGFLTNQFHKWSHQDGNPLWVRALQRLHLILPPEHHGVHHTPPHQTYYCITTGWMNAPLAAIGFWSKMEALLRIFGFEVSEEQDVRPLAVR